MKFVQKQRGAISIFLSLIMIPILIIASVMVDASRIRLARSVAESAGDLTLNTALSAYDNVLKDMYGLFAVSQSEEELFDNLEDYYANSLRSCGLSEKETSNYVKQIMEALGSLNAGGSEAENETDLLRISVVDDSFQTERPKTGSLINPALLKSQIVNFMKYRGPINVGLGFLDSLRSFSNLSDQMKVVETRDTYYKEQQKVLSSCEKAWIAIDNYNKLEITEKYMKEMGEKIDSYADLYEFVVQNLIRDYYNAKNVNLQYFNKIHLTYAKRETKDGKDFICLYYRDSPKRDFGSSGKNTSESQMQNLVDHLKTAADKYDEMLNEEKNQKYQIEPSEDGIYNIQRVIQFTRDNFTSEESSYAYRLKEMYLKYNALNQTVESLEEAIADCNEQIKGNKESIESKAGQIVSLSKNNIKGENKETIERLQSEISDLERNNEDLGKEIEEYNKVLNVGRSPRNSYRGKYNTAMNTFLTMSGDKGNGMYAVSTGTTSIRHPDPNTGAWVTETVKNLDLVNGKISKDLITEVSIILQDFAINKLKKGSELLHEASDKLNEVAIALQEGGVLKEAEEQWEDSTKKDCLNGEPLTEQNKEEIRTVKEFINKTEVDNLRKHLDEVQETLKSLKEEIDGYTFAGKKIYREKNADPQGDEKEIQIYMYQLRNDLKSKYDNSLGDLYNPPLEKPKLTSIAESIFQKYYVEPYTEAFNKKDQYTCDWTEEPLKSPELLKSVKDKTDEDSDSYNKFYKFLENNFKNVTDEEGKKKLEQNKKEEKEKEEVLQEVADNQCSEAEGQKKPTPGNIDSVSRPSLSWEGIKAAESGWTAGASTVSGGDMPALEQETDKDTALSGSSNGLFKLFAKLTEALADMGVTLRDDLFLSGYIRGMFTYDTLEKETIYNSMEGADKNELTTMQGKSLSAEQRKNMVSLTKIPFCTDYNKAYSGEIEYIIYGNQDTKTNKNFAYGTIFGIRFAFNTIYAVTDKDIRNGANAIATVICQPPPFTLAQPVVKYAIIIGIAIAESGLDMLCLQNGMKVPLYKTQATWQLSFENLFEGLFGAAKQFVADKAKEGVKSVVDAGESALQEWLNKSDEELKKIVSEGGETVKEDVNDLLKTVENNIKESISRFVGTAVEQVVNLCNKANNLSVTAGGGDIVEYGGRKMTRKEFILSELEKWQPAGGEEIQKTREVVLGYLKSSGTIDTIISAIDGTRNCVQDAAKKAMEDLSQTLSEKQEDLVDFAVTKLQGYINTAKEKVSAAVSQGANSLKDTLNGYIDKWAGGGSSTGLAGNANGANVAATFFSFQYSDYLQLFLLINLLINQDGVLLRTADVIEANMEIQKGAGKFSMEKAYTYISIKADMEVEPIMMYLPLMKEDTMRASGGRKDWYTIHYQGMQGYN